MRRITHDTRAPFDGVVTACPRSVGEVVNPGIALARIQRENAARILIRVPVQELNRVRAGMKVDVFLSESSISLTGTVRTLPVEVGPLPDRLRRYFRQNQRRQQYAPLEVIPDAGAVGLYGNARIDAVIHLYDNFKGGTEIFRPL